MKNTNLFLTMAILLFLSSCAAPTMEQKVAKKICECLDESGIEKAFAENKENVSGLDGIFAAFGVGMLLMKCHEDLNTEFGLDPANDGLDKEKLLKALDKECKKYKMIFEQLKNK